MTLKASEFTWLRRTVLSQRSQGPYGACPPALPHRPELRAATARSDFSGFEAATMTRGWLCLCAGFCCGGASAVADAIYLRAPRRPIARRSISPARLCAVSGAPPAARRCAARRGNGPARGRCATPAGRCRCNGGGGTSFPAPHTPRHGNVAVRAPVGARGYGPGRSSQCRCVAERATALKARVLHVRAWNLRKQLRHGVHGNCVMRGTWI